MALSFLRIPIGIRYDKGVAGMTSRLRKDYATMVGLLVQLMSVFPDHAPQGNVSSLDDEYLEMMSGWRWLHPRRRGEFARAFREEMCDENGVCEVYARYNAPRYCDDVNREWQRARKFLDVEGLFARDGYRCVSCGRSRDEVPLTLDHIIPKSQGGPHTPENLQTMCKPCNSSKGARVS